MDAWMENQKRKRRKKEVVGRSEREKNVRVIDREVIKGASEKEEKNGR